MTHSPAPSPESVVQRQLDAYNARDLDAWLTTYAPAAQQLDLTGRLLATGHEQIRARMQVRFAEPDLHAQLLQRSVLACPVALAGPSVELQPGAVITDHERVTRNFDTGLGSVEMLCIYQVADGLIQRASFAMATPVMAAAADATATPPAATAPLPAAEIIGLEHLYLSVSDLPRAERFYDTVLCQALGFRKNQFALGENHAPEPHIHYYNRHFGLVLRPARQATPHEPYAPGLHHLCLRADSAAEVNAVARQLQAAGIAATPAAVYTDYAPDYHATFFRDPDGIRLEISNYRQERRERHDRWHMNAPEMPQA